jgi:hypothetical protein
MSTYSGRWARIASTPAIRLVLDAATTVAPRRQELPQRPRTDSTKTPAVGSRRDNNCDRNLHQRLGPTIQRGNENCPMQAQTVQKITTMREFIHSAGMVTGSKEMEIEFLLDGARRPCSTLYRSLLQNNCKKNQPAAASSRCKILDQSAMFSRP